MRTDSAPIKSLMLFSLLLLFGRCMPPSPPAESVLTLAPPTDVKVQCDPDSCQITWRASQHAEGRKFAGYKIFVSQTSLLFASPKNLPAPISADKSDHMVKITKPETTAFIHVRSYTVDGKISLPSLPELKIAN